MRLVVATALRLLALAGPAVASPARTSSAPYEDLKLRPGR
jgi:hypothetical protein